MESLLIHQLSQWFPKPNSGFGIGDDCAVIPLDHERAWLLSTDSLVEGTHFCLKTTSPEQLAYKTLMVNVSDIAAMGGTPQSVLLNLALPNSHSGQWAERFLQELARLLKKFDIVLLGGDTVGSEKQLFINLTIFGTILLKNIKYRHGAQAGDVLATTKALGGSYAGLQCLLNAWQGPEADACIHQHLMPEAQLAEGQWLGQQPAVHSMMDLSDGLATDLPKLCAASQLGAHLMLDQLPIHSAAAALALAHQVRPIDIAYSGGEDYALLLSIAPEAFASVAFAYQQQFHQTLWPIGTLTSNIGQIDSTFQGKRFTSQLTSFEHFA